MSISEPFIRRPVMTTLLTLALLVFGIVAYRSLPVSDLPNVDFPTILVTANLPGASPETMASAVATPLERQFTTIAGLDSMTSTSVVGSTQVVLQFNLSRSLDAAALDVQSAISAAQGRLPQNMPTPPSYQKVNPADQPILYMALTTPTLPLYQLDEYAETLLAQRISTIPGVAQVQVFGAQKYAVRIQLDPKQLAARSIAIDEVSQAVQAANVNLPTGTLQGPAKAFTVQANGQLNDAAAFRPVVIASRQGAPVRLSDVGRALDSIEQDKTAAWYGDTRAMVLAVQRQPGTNTVEVARAVKAQLPKLQTVIPPSARLHLLYDRSESIEASVDDVKFTLLLTLILVVLVIFLFLRTVWATVIPSIALPMSIVGTFAVMWLLGYSLDNLSLMALTLSVGFVVDDAIVMLENVVRHIEMGEKPFAAALVGAREIGFTIVSMTISLSAVFIPVLFMGGIVGRLFREFSVTIAAAILISGVVSLTLTPMLCSRFLKPASDRPRGRLYLASERVFDRGLHLYEWALKWSLRHRLFVMAISLAVLLLTGVLFAFVPKGFLPSEDTGQIFGQTEAVQGISFQSMSAHQQEVASVIAQDPGVQEFMSVAGSGRGASSGNTGVVFLHLKPRNERPHVDDIIARLRPKLAQIPGIQVYLQNPPPIPIGGRLTKAQYQYTLQGTDTTQLYDVASKLEAKIHQIPGLTDVSSDLQLKNPQVDVRVDRDRAATLGLSLNKVEDALYTAFGSRQISTIYAPNNEYQVIMELLPEYQKDLSALQWLYLRSSSGQLVPLSSVAIIGQSVGPLTVNHSGQLPSVTISFNIAPGVALGNATAAVQRLAQETIPASITGSFQGTAQAFASSFAGLGTLLFVAVLVIYLVLGVLYEDYLHPLTILSALPFAGFGALLTLLVFRVDLTLYAFVGIILLVGLVKKNGIMMVDFAIERRREGKAPMEAIYEACVIRFRPIMMTTLAALMGTLPIALGYGAGAESRRPLGLAVVGGLLFSQMLTLFVTPVFYLYMEAAREKDWRRFLRIRRGRPPLRPAEGR